MTSTATFLLVHGAWHGSWCWDQVSLLLAERGHTVHTVDLPTTHAADPASTSLADDAEAVAQAIDAIDGPVVVVAHSYGGVPVTEAATDDRVRHIVYIAAFALDAGESLFGAVGGVAPDWWHSEGALTTAGDASQPPQQLFFGDVPAEQADAAAARLVPQSTRSFHDALTHVAWRGRPTTYVITELDGVVPVPAQEALAARSGSTAVRLPTSHSPFLSQPAALVDVLEVAATA